MPPKIRDLERVLKRAGFEKTAGKGSHRIWRHQGGTVLTMSGQGGDDAKPYQEKLVDEAVKKSRDG